MSSQVINAQCGPLVGRTLPRRTRDAVRDTLHFARAWLRDPASMAAVVPSGRALAALITRDIDRHSGPVLELGSGTGVFAAALLARGIAESDLTLVERDVTLARLLADRYPRATVRSIDAADLASAEVARFGATICGLGLLAMPPNVVEAIVAAAFRCMAPAGAFYLFTYGRRCSVPVDVLARLHLTAQRVGTTWRNLPPASVFQLTRRSVASAALPA